MCTAKKTKPKSCSGIPNRRKNQYATNASVRKPPLNASNENRAVSLAIILLVSGAISALAGTTSDGFATSTAGESNK